MNFQEGSSNEWQLSEHLPLHPTIILADEPTGNLDSTTGYGIMCLLKKLHKEGNCIVLITHENDIANQAEKRLHIIDGKIVSDSGREGALI